MQLRRVPKDLKKALSVRVKPEIAEPLAQRVSGAWTGPYAQVLATATKARAGAEPIINIGGARKVVSGGASPRQLVYGVEFGATGRRVVGVSAGKGHRSYSRKATRQFVGHHAPAVFPTIRRSGGWLMDKYADIVNDVLGKVVSGGK
jgi:hypothetical protein